MTKENNIEFGTEYVRREADKTFIAGWCYRGPISIGDVFNSVYELIPLKNEEGCYGHRVENNRPVDIYVVKMKAYGHELKEIYEGLSAEIEIAGEGCDLVKPRDVLSNVSSRLEPIPKIKRL
jgi:hypothetical protein